MAGERFRKPLPARFALLKKPADPCLFVLRYGLQIEIPPVRHDHNDVGPEARQPALGIPYLLFDGAVRRFVNLHSNPVTQAQRPQHRQKKIRGAGAKQSELALP